jgi:hypothetical protein
MRVDVSCRRCGRRERIDVGSPAPGQPLAEYLHLVDERLRHRPSFECFGGHLELRAPVPEFWDVHWDTAGD